MRRTSRASSQEPHPATAAEPRAGPPRGQRRYAGRSGPRRSAPGGLRPHRSWRRCPCTARAAGSAARCPRHRTLLCHGAQPGVGRDAADDDQGVRFLSRTARSALVTSTSTTACSKEAAMSATGTDSPARSMRSTVRATAVFSPENEKTNGASPGRSIARGNRKAVRIPADRRRGRSPAPLGTRDPAGGRPCRRPLPAASSRVSPRCSIGSRTRSPTARIEVWPPETMSTMLRSGSGPCSRVSAAACPARWWTPYSGLPSAQATISRRRGRRGPRWRARARR